MGVLGAVLDCLGAAHGVSLERIGAVLKPSRVIQGLSWGSPGPFGAHPRTVVLGLSWAVSDRFGAIGGFSKNVHKPKENP